MNYEIVATLGPASLGQDTWHAMLSAGVTAFRLNTSHLTLSQLGEWIDRIQAFLSTLETGLPLVLDLQGSKWRLGEFNDFNLEVGESIDLIEAGSVERRHALPVPHADFFKAVPASSGEIILDDGRIRLSLERVDSGSLRARVIQGGRISARKGITLAASDYRIESLTEKDRFILEQTQNLPFIHYALSYVKDSLEMAQYRKIFGASSYLIAKIERQPAIESTERITEYADELWLCRGDLGAELGLKGMALAVQQFSDRVARLPVPAFMAGQVLEHMVEKPVPTRSEVCYIYDMLRMGYRGFVLSDETAIGRYPVESCRIAAQFKN